MVSGAVNVYTSTSPSTIVDGRRDRLDRPRLAGFRGRRPGREDGGRRASAAGRRFRPARKPWSSRAGERVVAAARTRRALGARSPFRNRPVPILPADNRIYDLKTGDQVELQVVPACPTRRATGSRSRVPASSCPDANEVDLDDRTGLSARVKVSREGLLLLAGRGHQPARASPRTGAPCGGSRCSTEPLRAGTGDTTPPELSVLPPQQMGNLFLIFGKTERGSIVTVNAEPADVEADGSFKKTDHRSSATATPCSSSRPWTPPATKRCDGCGFSWNPCEAGTKRER